MKDATRDRTEANGTEDIREQRQSLRRLIVSPTVWAVHFLVCYVTAAVWCAKHSGDGDSLHTVRLAIAVFTAVALVLIAVNGWGGWRRHRFGRAPPPHDVDTPEDRHRFLGFATLLLAVLSAVATIFVALVALFFPDCR